MIELVYVSKATSRFNDVDLKEMLGGFRKNNQQREVTGLLLYDGLGTFIQALEGDEEVVTGLFNHIKSDTRHTRVNLLGESTITERHFPDWRMGFRNLDNISINGLEGYSDFLQQNDRARYLSSQNSFALELLDYFKNNYESGLGEG